MKTAKRISVIALLMAFCLCGIFIAQAASTGTYKWQNTIIKSAVSLYQSGSYYYAATSSTIYKVDASGNIVKTYGWTNSPNITSMSVPTAGEVMLIVNNGLLYSVNMATLTSQQISVGSITGFKKVSVAPNGTIYLSMDYAIIILNSNYTIRTSIPSGGLVIDDIYATSDNGLLTDAGTSVIKINQNGNNVWTRTSCKLPSNPALPDGNYLLMHINTSGQYYGFSRVNAINGTVIQSVSPSTRFYNVIYAGTSSGSYQYFASYVDGGSVQNGRLDPSGAPIWQIAGWSDSVMVAASDGSLVGGSFSMLASSYLKLNFQISTPILSLPTSNVAQSSSEAQASQANAGVSSASETPSSKSDAASSNASSSGSSAASIFTPDENDVGGSGGINVWMIATIVLIAVGAIATFFFVVLPRIRNKKPHGPQGPNSPQGRGAPQWPQDPQGMQSTPSQWPQEQQPPPQPQDIEPPQQPKE